MPNPTPEALVAKWRDDAEIAEFNSEHAHSVGLDDAAVTGWAKATAMRACADELESALAAEGVQAWEVEPREESAGQLLQRLGDDAAKWAAEFRATAVRLGYSDMDEGWLIGWFANAIENSSDVRHWRKQASLSQQPEARGVVGEETGEPCESGLPDCGPAVAWDCEGVGVCERCARELGWIATQHQEPTT